MSTYIQDIETDEILDYLRHEREVFILDSMSREEIIEASNAKLYKFEWRKFMEYCDESDANNRDITLKLLDEWIDSLLNKGKEDLGLNSDDMGRLKRKGRFSLL